MFVIKLLVATVIVALLFSPAVGTLFFLICVLIRIGFWVFSQPQPRQKPKRKLDRWQAPNPSPAGEPKVVHRTTMIRAVSGSDKAVE
jgi:hypothetical protein